MAWEMTSMHTIELLLIGAVSLVVVGWLILVLGALAYISEQLDSIVALLEERRRPPEGPLIPAKPWINAPTNTATCGFTHGIPRNT